MAFRAEVRRALAAPMGVKLSQAFAAPRVTVVVADVKGDERDAVALSELADALVHVGLSRGRLMVLLAGTEPPGPAAQERARSLRSTLGVPVVVHDPSRPSPYRPGAIGGIGTIALDDELREAEGVIVVSRFSRGSTGLLHGGPALLLPGLADAPTRERHAAAGSSDAASFAVLEHVEVDFALLWDASDPPRVRAGAGAELFAHCASAGWLDPAGRRGAATDPNH